MQVLYEKAEKLLRKWKAGSYLLGAEDSVYEHIGTSAAKIGKTALVVVADLGQSWNELLVEKVVSSLVKAKVDHQLILGAGPNAPREDVYRIALMVSMLKPACIVAVGGGSTIDAAKAASSLAAFTPAEKIELLASSLADASGIEPFFGVDKITDIEKETGRKITPIIAAQTAASSGAHLTKYANVTDLVRGIKKLEVDYAHVPIAAVFDFRTTLSAPAALKIDGALDGIAHCWEVFMGATGKCYYDQICEIAGTAIELIVSALPVVVNAPDNLQAHIALGLGTDLGGYAIMIAKTNPETNSVERGGTNGGHLGSFQLTDYLSHGRACALLNPYYTVLFANAIEDQCRIIGKIYQKYSYIDSSLNLDKLTSRELALEVAKGMIALSKKIKFPTALKDTDVPKERIAVMVEQSENPQLSSKLKNMPVPMNVDKGDVRRFILPTLEAAYAGDLDAVPTAQTVFYKNV